MDGIPGTESLATRATPVSWRSSPGEFRRLAPRPHILDHGLDPEGDHPEGKLHGRGPDLARRDVLHPLAAPVRW